jgi:hypothetical protein
MFLPNYKFDVDLGIWVSRDEKEQQTRLWLGEIDYSTGQMGAKQTSVRKAMPFEVLNQSEGSKKRLPLKDYIQMAQEHLVQTVENYKSAFGKSGVDQAKLIPEEYHELIWFLFPSQVLQEMLQLGKALSFEQLIELSESKLADQTLPFTTIFHPRDYNRNTYSYQQQTEYLDSDLQLEPDELKPSASVEESKNVDPEHETS